MFLVAVLGITIVYVQYTSSVSLAVAQFHDTRFYAVLLTLNAMLVILIELPLSGWTRRLPTWVPLVMGTVLIALGIPLSGSFPPYWLIIVGVVTWTVGEILFSPVVTAAVAELSPADRVGRYQGYLATMQAVAFAVGPAIGTFVYGVSPAVLWFGCVVLGGSAALAFAVTGLSAQRTTTLLEAR